MTGSGHLPPEKVSAVEELAPFLFIHHGAW